MYFVSPKNVLALYNLGVIDQKENKTSVALAYYDRALTSDSTYTPAMYNKAIILEATDLNAALALYKQIVAINPKASTAYLRMAFVYARQGQAAKLKRALEGNSAGPQPGEVSATCCMPQIRNC